MTFPVQSDKGTPMNWEHVGYAAACVVVPVGWGIVVVWASNHIERRLFGRRSRRRRRKERPIEYHI